MSMIDEEKLYRLIGQNIRNIRNNQKLTQSQLADRVGFNRTSITNIEQGTQKAPLHLLYRFCLETGTPLSAVLPSPEEIAKEIKESSNQVEVSTATERVMVSKGVADLIEELKQSTKKEEK